MVKYTTATKVKAMLGERVAAVVTDTEIEIWITEAEGIIDTIMKIGSGTGSDATFTFATVKAPHLTIEMAATCMAASITLANSTVSWQTMESAVFMQQTILMWWNEAMRILEDPANADFIKEQ